jgi:hypothetical protein
VLNQTCCRGKYHAHGKKANNDSRSRCPSAHDSV